MTQGFNFNFNPISEFGVDVLDKLQFKSPGTGFQLGASGPIRPSVMSQRFVPTVYRKPNIPSQSIIPGRNTIALPAQQKPLMLTTSGKPLPNQSSVINLGGDAGQVAYKLPNGTYTSNPDLARIAQQQVQRGQLLKDTAKLKSMGKVGGITGAISTPLAIMSHKDAYKYYTDMMNDESLPGEQRQLANAMRLKEAALMAAEGPGTAIGTAIGSRFGKWGSVAGGIIPGLVGQGIGAGIDYLAQPAIDKYGFQKYNGGINLGGFNIGGNKKSGKQDNTDKNADAILKGAGVQSGNKTATKQAGVSQQQAATLAQQLVDANGIQEPTEQAVNTQAINDYIQQLKDINQPYVDALKNYVDNYNNMLDQRQRNARLWQGVASLTGNPAWAKMGEQYNTLSNEANRVNAIKQLQDAQAGDINAINEVMGNMALAKEMDLPYEAAFANKNLLTALTANRRMLTDWEKAQLAAELKRYGIDVGYKKAIDVQGMRGQNALDVANTYMGGGVAPGLNAQGNIANYFK